MITAKRGDLELVSQFDENTGDYVIMMINRTTGKSAVHRQPKSELLAMTGRGAIDARVRQITAALQEAVQ